MYDESNDAEASKCNTSTPQHIKWLQDGVLRQECDLCWDPCTFPALQTPTPGCFMRRHVIKL
ncbi:hypothetical protein E2C01_056454 [Portunus trituberculatus]|uniref:Uncharacterized protein n=1 Tax=Portunus trituberculatus TaxID=210409 RepID=A0A5B7GXQ5_PORTR|nr:hypothetical protein [Portunus trituberculatus]